MQLGERIDVQVITPVDAHERAIIERELMLQAVFAPENGSLMVASGLPVEAQGLSAQEAQKHKGQLALLAEGESDGATQPQTSVCAVRFLFSI